MANFALQWINVNETIAPVYKLYRDGKCLIDDFIQMAKSNPDYEPLLGDLYSIVRRAANGEQLPKKLLSKVEGQSNAWEARKGHIRMYLYRQDNIVIIIGGDKNTQTSDLKQLKTIISEYKKNPPNVDP